MGIDLLDIRPKAIKMIIAGRLGGDFTEFRGENQCGSVKQKGYHDEKNSVNLSLESI